MQKHLTLGVILFGLATGTQAVSQNNLISNGRYMPSGFCFGLVVSANKILPHLSEETSLAGVLPIPILTNANIEYLKQNSIDLAKWEGSYKNWESDLFNGGNYNLLLAQKNIGIKKISLIKKIHDKMTECVQALDTK